MNLNRFGEMDWQEIRERLDAKEGGFDRGTFIAWLTSEGVEERLETKFGEDWSLSQALTLATGGPKALRRMGKKRLKELAEGDPEDSEDGPQMPGQMIGRIEDLESRVQARLDEYLNDFENVTVNDRASLRDLASAEIALGEMNKLRLGELAKEFPNPDTLKRFTESIKVLSEQTRGLQKMLDIDRVTRNAKNEAGSIEDQIMDIHEQMGKFVEDEAIELKDGNTLLGWLIPDFPEFEHIIRIKMPGRWAEVHYYPDAKALRALEPEWVAGEEAKYQGQVIGMEEE